MFSLTPPLILLWAAISLAQTPEQLLQEADAALQKEDYAAAAKVLESYLAQKPEDYRAEFNLAYAYSLTGRPAEAIRHYQNVLARGKDLMPAHRNLGILLFQQGNVGDALDHLRRIAEQQPNDLTVAFYLAESLSSSKQTPEARQAYERVLQLKPDHAQAHFSYAKLLAETDPRSAEEHLRTALENDPTLDDARLTLAALLEARAAGDPLALPEAAALYRKYLEAHPDRNDLRFRLGQLYIAQKLSIAAAEQLEAARAAGNSSLELIKALLQIYLQGAGPDKDKAMVLLQEALAEDADNVELRLLSGRLKMERKQYREAAEEFRRVTQLQPQAAEGYTNLASALYLLKEYPATVAALEKISALEQDTAGTYFLRAISLDKLRQVQPALENYQRFLEAAGGKNPDQEFQARQRIKILTRELQRRGARRQ